MLSLNDRNSNDMPNLLLLPFGAQSELFYISLEDLTAIQTIKYARMILMMQTEMTSETLDYFAELIRLIAPDYFIS
jgi:hypothetical protein